MRSSIRYRVFLYFSILILTVFIILILVVNKTIAKNNEAVISNELKNTRVHTSIYINQYFMLNKIDCVKDNFIDHSDAILTDIEDKLNIKGRLYDADGQVITSKYNFKNDFYEVKDLVHGKELVHALNKKSAYTIFIKNNSVRANISIPIIISERFLGVLSFSKDYSDLYQYGYRLRNIFTITLLITFGIMFIVSFVISNSIISPLTNLRRLAKDMTQGVFTGYADVKSKDEIGELAESFNIMKDQIHRNLLALERERLLLKESDSYRKKFFDNVAHEFKTPLTIIRGYAQVMEQNDFNDKDFCIKGASFILDECDRLYRMVESLLAISRQTACDIESLFDDVDLTVTIKNICDEMKLLAASRSMNLQYTIDPDMKVRGYIDDLRSALVNIIDNAIKYGYERSVIEIFAAIKADYAEVIVFNKGVGIPSDKLQDVFEPFYRVSPGSGVKYDGSGLGLSIVKNIVENHSGIIEIESVFNEYTKVILKLPLNVNKFETNM